MIRFFMFFIDKIDEVRSFAASIIGASTGTAIGIVSNVTSTTEPQWFADASPILQTVAWCVAILAGLATFIKMIVSWCNKPKSYE